jgi:hypothetical protein
MQAIAPEAGIVIDVFSPPTVPERELVQRFAGSNGHGRQRSRTVRLPRRPME